MSPRGRAGGALAVATRHATLGQIRFVRPVAVAQARGPVAEVYTQVERDFGLLAPPVALHSPAPEALAACWMMLRETLIAAGEVSRPAKEAVAAAVSAANACPYCVEVHGAALAGLGGRVGSLPAMTPDSVPELVGVAVTFHYLNRMVNVFLPPSPVPATLPPVAARGVRWLAPRLMGALARGSRSAGASLHLLPPASLPADLSWARGSPGIAEAMARATTAIEAGGHRSVPPAARQLVLSHLDGWSGRPVGLDHRRRMVDMVAGLDPPDRPVGLLALLIATASERVRAADVGAVRATGAGDDELIELAAWSAMSAARRIGTRLNEGGPLPSGAEGGRDS